MLKERVEGSWKAGGRRSMVEEWARGQGNSGSTGAGARRTAAVPVLFVSNASFCTRRRSGAMGGWWPGVTPDGR